MFRFIRLSPLLLLLLLSSCNSDSDYTAFQALFLDKGGDFRGFSLGMSMAEIKGQELVPMKEKEAGVLALEVLLKDEGASLENSALIEYSFDEANKMDQIFASIILEDKKMVESLRKDVKAHLNKLYGEPRSGVEIYPSWIWEAPTKTIVFAEPQSEYETFTLDFYQN